jgi:hypothetical protein
LDNDEQIQTFIEWSSVFEYQRKSQVIDILIIIVMFGIFASLGSGLYFLVHDRGKTERTVISLSIRVALAILLLVLLALGFVSRY